jgi:hypothetical protein
VAQGDPGWEPFLEELQKLFDMDIELVVNKVKLPKKVGDKDVVVQSSVLYNLEKFIEVS